MTSLRRRNTLSVPSGTSHDPDKRHLFVICSNPSMDGRVLMVSFSRVKAGCPADRTCVLEPYEMRHPDLPLASFVNYKLARIERADRLAAQVAAGIVTRTADLNEHVVLRIMKGFETSPGTRDPVKAYLSLMRPTGVALNPRMIPDDEPDALFRSRRTG